MDVSKISLAGQVLNISDTQARDGLASLASVPGQIAALTSKTASLVNFKRTVIIGDSWSAAFRMPNGLSDTFGWKFCKLMGGDDPFVIAVGNLGFASSGSGGEGNALAFFNSKKSEIDDPEGVTAVLVCLGLNDRYSSEGDIMSGAAGLFSAIKEYLPNADIVYMPNPNWSPVSRLKILHQMPLVCSANSVTYVDSYWWCLLDNDLFLDDKFHPSQTGNNFIAGCLYSTFTGGAVYHGAQFTTTLDDTTMFLIAERDTITIYGTPIIGSVAEKNILKWDPNLFKGSGSAKAPGLGWRFVTPIGNFVNGMAQLIIEPNSEYIVLKNGQTPSGGYLSGATRVNVTFNAANLLA